MPSNRKSKRTTTPPSSPARRRRDTDASPLCCDHCSHDGEGCDKCVMLKPTPPQPGDTVLVEAVVHEVFQDGNVGLKVRPTIHSGGYVYGIFPPSAIHPAPAKK